MAKVKKNREQRMVFKLSSKRLKRDKWNIKLSLQDAFKNDELISLADSQALRFIYDINKKSIDDENDRINFLRKELKLERKKTHSTESRRNIKNIYNEIHKTLFVEDYITVVFDTIKDFDKACKDGFFVNKKKFKRFIGTPAGVKKRTIIFVSEKIYDKLNKKIINGAKPIEIIPAKLEAYRSLAFSSSIPVPNTKNILVTNDWETHFKADITQVGDNNGELYVESVKDADMSLEDSDGYGAISPRLSKIWCESLGLDYLSTGYVIRHSYAKGSLFTFDIHDFADKIGKKKIIKDVWGNDRNIDDIDIIMPVSMMKLWKAYDSLEDYLDNCDKNGYTFSITKVMPETLENYRDMNYQFLQSLRLNDEQIQGLIQPTIDEIKDVLGNDYRKSLLFLRGQEMNDKNAWNYNNYDFVEALMIDKRMINDPFVRQHIHRMIRKRIQKAKTGVIRVEGNFSIISGDIYGYMEFVFGLEAKGLLKAGEFYNHHWSNKGIDKVLGFRAPQTTHENIALMNLIYTQKARYWYRYMPCCTIFNAWDCTCHTLNGAD